MGSHDYEEGTGMNEHKGLGRIAAPDERDQQYLLRAVMPAAQPLPRYRHYRTGKVLDQGPYPHCVGYAWKQWLASAPLMTKTGPEAQQIYHECQKVDEWPGENYDGTSVRAGAKVLQAMGHIQEYRWAWSVEDLRQWVLGGNGSVVLGTLWYQGMSYPDKYGMVSPTGRVLGGHAYLLVGYNDLRGVFTCVNSWSKSWGDGGRFRIAGEAVQRLLDQDGEACCGVEVRQ